MATQLEKSSSLDILTPAQQLRRQESIEIKDAGPLVAAVRASINLFVGRLPVEMAIDAKEQVLDGFNSNGRNGRIKIIQETQTLLEQLNGRLNQGCRETSAAFATRRLQIVQIVVQSEIAVGLLAVNTADILLGNRSFGIDGLSLVSEWRNRQLEVI